MILSQRELELWFHHWVVPYSCSLHSSVTTLTYLATVKENVFNLSGHLIPITLDSCKQKNCEFSPNVRPDISRTQSSGGVSPIRTLTRGNSSTFQMLQQQQLLVQQRAVDQQRLDEEYARELQQRELERDSRPSQLHSPRHTPERTALYDQHMGSSRDNASIFSHGMSHDHHNAPSRTLRRQPSDEEIALQLQRQLEEDDDASHKHRFIQRQTSSDEVVARELHRQLSMDPYRRPHSQQQYQNQHQSHAPSGYSPRDVPFERHNSEPYMSHVEQRQGISRDNSGTSQYKYIQEQQEQLSQYNSPYHELQYPHEQYQQNQYSQQTQQYHDHSDRHFSRQNSGQQFDEMSVEEIVARELEKHNRNTTHSSQQQFSRQSSFQQSQQARIDEEMARDLQHRLQYEDQLRRDEALRIAALNRQAEYNLLRHQQEQEEYLREQEAHEELLRVQQGACRFESASVVSELTLEGDEGSTWGLLFSRSRGYLDGSSSVRSGSLPAQTLRPGAAPAPAPTPQAATTPAVDIDVLAQQLALLSTADQLYLSQKLRFAAPLARDASVAQIKALHSAPSSEVPQANIPAVLTTQLELDLPINGVSEVTNTDADSDEVKEDSIEISLEEKQEAKETRAETDLGSYLAEVSVEISSSVPDALADSQGGVAEDSTLLSAFRDSDQTSQEPVSVAVAEPSSPTFADVIAEDASATPVKPALTVLIPPVPLSLTSVSIDSSLATTTPSSAQSTPGGSKDSSSAAAASPRPPLKRTITPNISLLASRYETVAADGTPVHQKVAPSPSNSTKPPLTPSGLKKANSGSFSSREPTPTHKKTNSGGGAHVVSPSTHKRTGSEPIPTLTKSNSNSSNSSGRGSLFTKSNSSNSTEIEKILSTTSGNVMSKAKSFTLSPRDPSGPVLKKASSGTFGREKSVHSISAKSSSSPTTPSVGLASKVSLQTIPTSMTQAKLSAKSTSPKTLAPPSPSRVSTTSSSGETFPVARSPQSPPPNKLKSDSTVAFATATAPSTLKSIPSDNAMVVEVTTSEVASHDEETTGASDLIVGADLSTGHSVAAIMTDSSKTPLVLPRIESGDVFTESPADSPAVSAAEKKSRPTHTPHDSEEVDMSHVYGRDSPPFAFDGGDIAAGDKAVPHSDGREDDEVSLSIVASVVAGMTDKELERAEALTLLEIQREMIRKQHSATLLADEQMALDLQRAYNSSADNNDIDPQYAQNLAAQFGDRDLSAYEKQCQEDEELAREFQRQFDAELETRAVSEDRGLRVDLSPETTSDHHPSWVRSASSDSSSPRSAESRMEVNIPVRGIVRSSSQQNKGGHLSMDELVSRGLLSRETSLKIDTQPDGPPSPFKRTNSDNNRSSQDVSPGRQFSQPKMGSGGLSFSQHSPSPSKGAQDSPHNDSLFGFASSYTIDVQHTEELQRSMNGDKIDDSQSSISSPHKSASNAIKRISSGGTARPSNLRSRLLTKISSSNMMMGDLDEALTEELRRPEESPGVSSKKFDLKIVTHSPSAEPSRPVRSPRGQKIGIATPLSRQQSNRPSEEKTEDDFLDCEDVTVIVEEVPRVTVQDVYFQQKQKQYHRTPRSSLLDFTVLSDLIDAMVTTVVVHSKTHENQSVWQLDALLAASLDQDENDSIRLSVSLSQSRSERNTPSNRSELSPSAPPLEKEEDMSYRLTDEQLAEVLAQKAAQKEEKKAKKRAFKKEQRDLERQIRLQNRDRKVSIDDLQKALRSEQRDQKTIEKIERAELIEIQNTLNQAEAANDRINSTPRSQSQYTPHVITNLTFYENLLKKVFNILPQDDSEPLVAFNTVVRYLPPETDSTEVEIPLVAPDSEEAQYRAMRLLQSDQTYMDRQSVVRQARCDFENHKRAYMQPVYNAFPTFLLLGKQWISAVAEICDVADGICICILLPNLRDLRLDIVSSSQKHPLRGDTLSIEAERCVYRGDHHACDENSLYFGRFKLDGLGISVPSNTATTTTTASTRATPVLTKTSSGQDIFGNEMRDAQYDDSAVKTPNRLSSRLSGMFSNFGSAKTTTNYSAINDPNNTSMFDKTHLSYRYANDVGLLFIYVDRIQLHAEAPRSLMSKGRDKISLPVIDSFSPRHRHNVGSTPRSVRSPRSTPSSPSGTPKATNIAHTKNGIESDSNMDNWCATSEKDITLHLPPLSPDKRSKIASQRISSPFKPSNTPHLSNLNNLVSLASTQPAQRTSPQQGQPGRLSPLDDELKGGSISRGRGGGGDSPLSIDPWQLENLRSHRQGGTPQSTPRASLAREAPLSGTPRETSRGASPSCELPYLPLTPHQVASERSSPQLEMIGGVNMIRTGRKMVEI
eukprot:gene22420-28544_t